MSNLSRWFRLSLALLTIIPFATACFRDAAELIEDQPVAREYPSPTVGETMAPSPLPATAIPEIVATEPVVDQFALTATALIARQTEPAAGPESSAELAAVPGVSGTEQATSVPIPRETIPPGQDCVHEIRAGDTLFQLSLAYGVDVNAIAEASEIIDPDRIAVGQQVTIPQCGTTGFIPPPTSVPVATIEAALVPATEIAGELDIASSDDTQSALIEQAQAILLDNAQSNSLDEFSAQLSGTATPSQTYTVQQNDTLFEIATRFGTTVEVLAALNGITDVDSLNAGDVLQIP